jgi:hypothetical protein
MDKAILGFYTKAGVTKHSAALTGEESACLDYTRTYNSRPGDPCIPARTLADFLYLDTRSLRSLINHLVDRDYHGMPIYALPGSGGGYFVADTPRLIERAKSAIDIQLARAQTSAKKARNFGANDKELAQGVAQMALDLGPGVQKEVVGVLTKKRSPASHKEVVTRLRRYAKDPEAFAAEIKQLRQEFGEVFVRKEDLERVLHKQTATAIEAAIAELSSGKAA